MIASIKNELKKSGVSIGGKHLQKTKVLSHLSSWLSVYAGKEGKPDKYQNKVHAARKRPSICSNQEKSPPEKKFKPLSTVDMPPHIVSRCHNIRYSGGTPSIFSENQNRECNLNCVNACR
ncbi:hypothetical protein [Endozoicomonas atrinae]|uniref:hypothetical protein n=1 Tax=Endozoicomonas atrinae TaxID=1333660 RepID=UPI0011130187|nr:hypothetical protein [Endozoicomonas atrinae]